MTYQLTANDAILRLADNAFIPPDPANRDYADYLAWLDEGNEPEHAPEPPAPGPEPTTEEKLQRMGLTPQDLVSVLEGAAGVTIADIKKAAALAKNDVPV
jgi:hypothetical protein